MSNKEDKIAEEEIKDAAEIKEALSEEKVEEKVEEKKELTSEEKLKVSEDKFLRLFSEFENFRRRTQKEKANLITGASVDAYKIMLPILDDFDLSLIHI